MAMSNLSRRLAALEAARPATGSPSVVILRPLQPVGVDAQALQRVKLLGSVLERDRGESEASFQGRISASAGRTMPLAIEVLA